MWHVASVEREGRADRVLDSPTAAVFYTAETFTTGFVVLSNTPPRSNVARYQTQLPKQTATRRTTIRRQRERDTSPSLRTTSASGFDHHHSCLSISPLHLFTRGSRTLPSTMPPKLMTIQASSPVDSNRRSAHQLQGCAFYEDILVDTACYSGLAWECGRLAC
ncbi:hypothetical protein ARMGADRAFT_1171510 [Armillaria gallica]|uniref:Uncharacterized protein n=1 Tax=Armillaria gallica TaxID=47427 RepID=A0A2H3CWQ0_ARMGA|nr:hypothetical protein ARMGADRAFT_1171510 [Armillaria gallica]